MTKELWEIFLALFLTGNAWLMLQDIYRYNTNMNVPSWWATQPIPYWLFMLLWISVILLIASISVRKILRS